MSRTNGLQAIHLVYAGGCGELVELAITPKATSMPVGCGCRRSRPRHPMSQPCSREFPSPHGQVSARSITAGSAVSAAAMMRGEPERFFMLMVLLGGVNRLFELSLR